MGELLVWLYFVCFFTNNMFVLKCGGVTSLYVTLSCCLSIFLFLVFFFWVCLFFLLAALSFFFSLSSTFTFAGGVRIGRLAC